MPPLSGILLVDDDPTSTFLTQRLLRRLVPDVPVLVAGNGTEGLQALQQALAPPAPADDAPWLVLLDLNMPVLNGFGFLEAYRHLPDAQRRRVVVVVLTTSLHGADLERLQALPIAGLMAKPLTEEKVQSVLRDSVRTMPPPGGLPARVFRLLYRSRAVRPLPEAELFHLLSQARQANAAAQITGVLVYRDAQFVQVLEGAETAVCALYDRIRQDPRHTEVVTVSQTTDCPRHLAHWRMALGRGKVPAVARLFEATVVHTALGQEVAGMEALLQDVSAALAPRR